MILGTDVSAAQGPALDWPAIAATDVRFAICKSSESAGYVDRTFSRNASCARAASLAVGSYHYFDPRRDPEQQATLYHSVAASAVTLPPVIDFETLRGVAPSDALARAIAFVEATESLWRRRCVVYSYPSFLAQLGAAALSPLASRLLWIAHYGVAAPTVPAPWTSWTCWQFDGDGGRKLPGGIDADFDRLAVGIDELVASSVIAPTTMPAADATTPDPIEHAASTIADEAHRLAWEGET